MTVSKKECDNNVKSMTQKIDEVKEKVQRIEISLAALPKKIIDEIDERYVSQDSFAPVQKLVYGLVGALLVAIVSGIMAIVLKK